MNTIKFNYPAQLIEIPKFHLQHSQKVDITEFKAEHGKRIDTFCFARLDMDNTPHSIAMNAFFCGSEFNILVQSFGHWGRTELSIVLDGSYLVAAVMYLDKWMQSSPYGRKKFGKMIVSCKGCTEQKP